MAAPTDDWINQAVAEVIAALTASPYFMSPDSEDAPEGASGVVMAVEDSLPETEKLLNHELPHCGVVYLGHDIADQDAATQTDYRIEIGLRLYNRGGDRREVWQALQKAAAAVSKVVSLEMGPDGSRFNGFANLARDSGGQGIDVKENGGYGAILPTGIVLDITRPDY